MVGIVAALMFSQGSIATDPRLMDRLGFDYSNTPLAQFVEIARASNVVPLSIDPSLEYLKVDAFVDDVPLGVTLSKLSEAFGLEWQRDGTGYKLVPNKTTLDQQKSYIADENSQIVKSVDHDIAVFREIDRLVPKNDKPWGRVGNRFLPWIPAKDSALAELERAKENKESVDKIEPLQIKYEALKQICDGLPNLQLARLFGSMNLNEVAQMRNGIPFIASNDSKSKFHYSLGDIKPNPSMEASTAVKSVLIARIDPDSHRVTSKEMTFLGNMTAMAAEPAHHYPFDDLTPVLSKRPFAVALKEWDQKDEFKGSFGSPFDLEPEDRNGDPSPWYEQRQRLGDHLRWFHRVTHIPVIAPADRIVHPFVKSYRQAKTQGEYVTKLLNACNGFGRKSDNFLLVRDGVYWRKSADELSEDVLAQLEHPRNGKLKFSDFIGLSSSISHTQAMLLEDSNGFVLKFPRYRFAESYPALKFLGSLDEEQIRIALDPKGGGLPFPQLRDAQQKQFANSVIDGITGRGFVSDPMLSNLIYGGVSWNLFPGMKFVIHNHVMGSASYSSETVLENGREIELAPKRTFANRPTTDFKFESNDHSLNVIFLTENIGL